MEGGDPEVMAAYYCFVNHGWPPSQYINLPFFERALVKEFILKDLKTREKEMQAMKR